MKKVNKRKDTLFWIVDLAAMLVLTPLYFVVIGYNTLVLCLLALCALATVYKLISVLGRKHARGAKILRTVLNSLVCLGLVIFAVTELFVISSAHTDKDPDAPYLIVLGAGVNGTEPSLSLWERLNAAKQYLDEHPATVAVVSGGQGAGEQITEAECMRRWLVANGISENRILLEQKSTSTYENLKFSLQIIRDDGGDPKGKIAVLSNEYHLYRAKFYAKELGTNAVGVAANTEYLGLRVNYFIREAFGVAYMWILEQYLGHA